MTEKLVAIDTETTGLRVWQGDKAIMSSFATDDGAWALPRQEAGAEIQKYIDAGYTIIMHSSPFDRAVFKSTWGIEVPDNQIYDTMAIDWLLDENADHRLKEGLGVRMFGLDAKKEKDDLRALFRGRPVPEVYRELRDVENQRPRKEREKATVTRERAREIAQASKRDWTTVSFEELHDYAVKDADLTLSAYYKQQELLDQDPYVKPDIERQVLLGGLAYRMSRTGIKVDVERAEAGLLKAEEQVAELSHKFDGVNLRSPDQVATMLYDDWKLPVGKMTKGKKTKRSTDKEALEALAWDPRVADLMEFRRLAKQVDAYYLPLVDRLSDDGRVHPSFNPWRTVTGRWSCSGPNLFTIPRETTAAEIRKVFVPERGRVLGEWDMKQQEPRIMADMAQERGFLDIYDVDGDLYQQIADDLGIKRQEAKVFVLMTGYGACPKRIAMTLARDRQRAPDLKEAEQVYYAYWRKYRQLKRLNDGLSEISKRRGYLPLWKPGRRRLFRSPSNPYPRYYTSLNAAVQGGGACLFGDIMLELEPAIADVGRLLINIYDSIVLEHEPGAEDFISKQLKTITEDCSPYNVDLPWEWKPWK